MSDPTQTTLPEANLRHLAEAAMPGPWHACGQDRGGCSCGFVYSEPADAPVAKVTIGVWGDQWPEIRQVQVERPERTWGQPPEPSSLRLEPYMEMMEYGEIPEHVGKANAAFISAANPQTILSLLDEIERLRSRVAELESITDGC
jgi:hypothetical protein